MINYNDFAKVELKVGTVLSADKIDKSDKLLKLMVDIGEAEPRQILAGIAQFYTPEKFCGQQKNLVANLEPRPMMGTVSMGMLLAADDTNGPVILQPKKPVPPGTKVR